MWFEEFPVTGEYARLYIEFDKRGNVESWRRSGLPDLWVFRSKCVSTWQ